MIVHNVVLAGTTYMYIYLQAHTSWKDIELWNTAVGLECYWNGGWKIYT